MCAVTWVWVVIERNICFKIQREFYVVRRMTEREREGARWEMCNVHTTYFVKEINFGASVLKMFYLSIT